MYPLKKGKIANQAHGWIETARDRLDLVAAELAVQLECDHIRVVGLDETHRRFMIPRKAA